MIRMHSLRQKLVAVVMLTTLAALLVSVGILIAYDLRQYHRALLGDMSTQAELLGHMTSAALSLRRPAPGRRKPGAAAHPAAGARRRHLQRARRAVRVLRGAGRTAPLPGPAARRQRRDRRQQPVPVPAASSKTANCSAPSTCAPNTRWCRAPLDYLGMALAVITAGDAAGLPAHAPPGQHRHRADLRRSPTSRAKWSPRATTRAARRASATTKRANWSTRSTPC